MCRAMLDVSGYMTDPTDCTVCTCKPLPTPFSHTPISTTPTTTLGGPISPVCYEAEWLSAARCSVDGYLTDLTDCTLCICKSDVPNVGK